MICETWELAVLALVAFLCGVAATVATLFAWAACVAKREADLRAGEIHRAAVRDAKTFKVGAYRLTYFTPRRAKR